MYRPSSRTSHHLVGQQQHCLEAELPGAEVEKVLQTGAQQLHHHYVVVALGATPLNGWNAHWRGETRGLFLVHCEDLVMIKN